MTTEERMTQEREIVEVAGAIRHLARETATPSLYVLARHWRRDREARPAIVTAVHDHIATKRGGDAAALFGQRARRAVWHSETLAA